MDVFVFFDFWGQFSRVFSSGFLRLVGSLSSFRGCIQAFLQGIIFGAHGLPGQLGSKLKSLWNLWKESGEQWLLEVH